MEIIQRKEAKILGLKRYFTNKPCPKGHISERMVSNKCCIQCLYFNAKTSNGRLRQRGYVKKSYQKNRDKRLAYASNYNKNIYVEQNKKHALNYYYKNLEIVKTKHLNYYYKNRKDLIKKSAEYNKQRKETDPEFKILMELRNRLNGILRQVSLRKKVKTLDYIGCTPNFLIKHIESNFLEGMTWKNRKLWHLDHDIPANYFMKNYDFKNLEIQKICFNWRNLFPLWSKDNLIKGSKINKKYAEKKINQIRKFI